MQHLKLRNVKMHLSVVCVCFQIDAKTGMVMNMTDLKKCIEVTFEPFFLCGISKLLRCHQVYSLVAG